MWIYFVGPFVALLPRRWRQALPFYEAVRWRSAGIVSGMGEGLFALVALLYWYSYSVTTWVSKGLDQALAGKAPPGITEHEIGFAGLVIFATHPLTWAICCVAIEGAVRLCAPFTDTVLGVFPLYVLEKVYFKLSGQVEPVPPGTPEFDQGHVSSYVGAVRERVKTARRSQVPDELCTTQHDSEEFLEIRSCRAKQDWGPPRVVRFEDRYYRLEETARGQDQRPYVYKLRRLPAGVPGRTVLIYSPDEAPLIANG